MRACVHAGMREPIGEEQVKWIISCCITQSVDDVQDAGAFVNRVTDLDSTLTSNLLVSRTLLGFSFSYSHTVPSPIFILLSSS